MDQRAPRVCVSMRAPAALLGATVLGWCVAVQADPAQFPRPPQLEPDVQFWQRVYANVTTQGGLMHDDRYLAVVYEELTFPAGMTPHERANVVDLVRDKYERMLRKLASGPRENLTDEESRVLAMFPANVSAAALREAADHVRFQLGQADRFREGLVRSGAWEHHVEETLRKEGLPPELSALPHVESSFNPRAYSKVGAAGLWQFMRSTGRRWLRVDNVVDERLDPYKSTIAAAQFLNINYSILGTWPLALTAYNHGAGGMRRAKELMGTDDIAAIVRNYQSKTFGFASRNFYVSFLAALEIDRNTERFFGKVERQPAEASRTVRLPYYVPAQSLARALGTDRETLQQLNLALLDPVWSGRRFVPRGFEVHVPASADPAQLLARLGGSERYDGQMRDATHRVRRGETLERIAISYGLQPAELAEYNGISADKVKSGVTLKLPPAQPLAAGAAPRSTVATAVAVAPADSYVVQSGDVLSTIARRVGISERELLAQNGIKDPNFLYEGQTLRIAKGAAAAAAPPAEAPTESLAAEQPRPQAESARAKPQPVSKEEAAALGPGLVPGIESAASADPSDYSVNGDTVIVQGAETLGHFADWLHVSPARLRELNHLGPEATLALGRRIHVDLSRVNAATFERRRGTYHHQLQDDFFQHFRIIGQQRHRLTAGESLWTLTQRSSVPVWLLRQYNPETDFATLRIGNEIILPRVEAAGVPAAAAGAPPAAAPPAAHPGKGR